MEAFFPTVMPSYELPSMEICLLFAAGQLPSHIEYSIHNLMTSSPKSAISSSLVNDSPQSNMLSTIKREKLSESPDGKSLKDQVAFLKNLISNHDNIQEPDIKEEIKNRVVSTLKQVAAMFANSDDLTPRVDDIETIIQIAQKFLNGSDQVHLCGDVIKGYRVLKEKRDNLLKKQISPKKPAPIKKKIPAKKKESELNTIFMSAGWGVSMRSNTGNNFMKSEVKNTISSKNKAKNTKNDYK